MFSLYFEQRIAYQITDATLSVLSFFVGAYFTWKLTKVYNNQSFKTVGAPEHVMKLYKFFHGLQACLILEVFVIAAAMALWADQFLNSYIGTLSEHTKIYVTGFIATGVLLLPWLGAGWYAIRREHKVMMICFLASSFIMLFGWTVMFYSQIVRWTFLMWPNLACYTVAAQLLVVISVALGIICCRHYGEGLAQYLNVEAILSSSNFAADRFEVDVEKNGMSYDSDAIIYELSRKNSGKSRFSGESFSTASPVNLKLSHPEQPQPTFFLPTLSKTRRGSDGSSSFDIVSPTVGFSPLRRNSKI